LGQRRASLVAHDAFDGPRVTEDQYDPVRTISVELRALDETVVVVFGDDAKRSPSDPIDAKPSLCIRFERHLRARPQRVGFGSPWGARDAEREDTYRSERGWIALRIENAAFDGMAARSSRR
jgi:hypothetical protein